MASIHSSPGARKFGEDASLYDYARPEYPSELFAWLQQRCGLNSQSDCFEIGAGTGLGTLPVLAMPVGSLLAIEPDTRLAERLREKTLGNARLTIAEARFESVQLEHCTYDFGFAAMSLHWLARAKALARVHAALKHGGHFTMWWNVYHNPSAPDAFGLATEHLFSGIEQDPKATSGIGAFGLDAPARMGELRNAGFSDVEQRVFEQQVTFTPEQLSALYGTFSRVRMAPETTRTQLLGETERIALEVFGGAVTRVVTCSAFVGRRT